MQNAKRKNMILLYLSVYKWASYKNTRIEFILKKNIALSAFLVFYLNAISCHFSEKFFFEKCLDNFSIWVDTDNVLHVY